MNDLEQLRINEIINLHSEVADFLRMSLDKAIRIGELLVEQKRSLKHGEFIPWIKSNLPFTDRTARNYIRLYEGRICLKTETISNLTRGYKILANPAGEIKREKKIAELKQKEIQKEPCDPFLLEGRSTFIVHNKQTDEFGLIIGRNEAGKDFDQLITKVREKILPQRSQVNEAKARIKELEKQIEIEKRFIEKCEREINDLEISSFKEIAGGPVFTCEEHYILVLPETLKGELKKITNNKTATQFILDHINDDDLKLTEVMLKQDIKTLKYSDNGPGRFFLSFKPFSGWVQTGLECGFV